MTNDQDNSSAVDSDILLDEAKDDDDLEKQEIAKSETKAVRWLKLAVIVVLLLSALGVALAVYFYISQSEQNQFESAFQGRSHKVLEGIGSSFEKTLGALDAFQIVLVSSARSTNQTWPFVTIDDFAMHASKMRMLSGTVLTSVYPKVTKEQRLEWEAYSLENNGWVNDSMKLQETDAFYYGPVHYDIPMSGLVHDNYDETIPYNTSLMLPTWQNSPVVGRYDPTNWDYMSLSYSDSTVTDTLTRVLETNRAILSATFVVPDPVTSTEDELAQYAIMTDYLRDFVPTDQDPSEPNNDIYYPIVDFDFGSIRMVDTENVSHPSSVGLLTATFYWRELIKDLLPPGSDGIVVVFTSECSSNFTYQIDGPDAIYLGPGDLHETQFDYLGVESSLRDLNSYFIGKSHYTGIPLDQDFCPTTLKVYPSTTMQVEYISSNPILFTIGAILIFGFTSSVFLLYDFMVERRQRKVLTTAVRTNAIVSSLFPSVVRDRIYETEIHKTEKGKPRGGNTRSRLKSFLNDGTFDQPQDGGDTTLSKAPVAEMFPDATVFFADIAGFTAWSSAREPTQVFTLLETLYGAFDAIARQRGVFKIETIGDCYVAVCGLPEPRFDHAVVMARFARDCRNKINVLTHELGMTLGPDTRDLKLRIGLNSGPVTAGVLRGDRARFQLFGDTVNCAARMESNGKPNMIHVSQKTADLLRESGKGLWLKKREELIEAKGKGTMQTYWVEPQQKASSRDDAMSDNSNSEVDDLQILGMLHVNGMAEQLECLIAWNFDTLVGLVKEIVAKRESIGRTQHNPRPALNEDTNSREIAPRSELSETIMVPDTDTNGRINHQESSVEVALKPEVLCQLRDYISAIAYTYRSNAFHNFEHASHVAMSLMKLLHTIAPPEMYFASATSTNRKQVENEEMSNIHCGLHSFISDPLTMFATILAALVHDVDHPGVSNAQLVAEHSPLALSFMNQSPAEQNSVVIAWELLMQPAYDDLRVCLFAHDENELSRFRQLLVNLVMATDLFDPELKAKREIRWELAFSHPPDQSSTIPIVQGMQNFQETNTTTSSMLLVVLECLMQAANVAHTMQHWDVYRKWNQRLFQETYAAFRSGRGCRNPADGWYQGELLFYDQYVIPLATKLKECRVLGRGSYYEELLDRAVENRREWVNNGQAILEEFVQALELLEI